MKAASEAKPSYSNKQRVKYPAKQGLKRRLRFRSYLLLLGVLLSCLATLLLLNRFSQLNAASADDQQASKPYVNAFYAKLARSDVGSEKDKNKIGNLVVGGQRLEQIKSRLSDLKMHNALRFTHSSSVNLHANSKQQNMTLSQHVTTISTPKNRATESNAKRGIEQKILQWETQFLEKMNES